MKKLIYLLLLLPLLCMQSCVEEEEDIFDAPASERLAKALEEYRGTLQASTNGWVMEYYPESTQMYGGYIFLLSFGKEGEVTVSSEIADTQDSVSSLYRLIAETGPVLTFDSYNEIFHFFSEPSRNNKQEGYAGDYEFIFMDVTPEKIILKGKKTENTYIMTPLAAEVRWPDYLQQIADMSEKLQAVPAFRLKAGEQTVDVMRDDRKLYLTYTEGANIEQVDVAYLYTDKGINFYKPVEIGGKTFQHFKLSEDGSYLVSTEDANVRIEFVYPPLNEAFALTTNQWYADPQAFQTPLKEAWNQALQACLIGEGELLSGMFIGYYKGAAKAGSCFALGTNAYWAMAGVDFLPVAGTEDQIGFRFNGTDLLNYSFYVGYYQPLIDLIIENSPYTMAADDDKNPVNITFTSTVDPRITFTVEKN